MYLEPVDKWKLNLIALENHEDGAAYRMQTAVLDHFASLTLELSHWSETLRERHERGIALIERSPWDVINVFLPANEKMLTPLQYQICFNRAVNLIQEPCWRLSCNIMVMASFDECFRRIRRRFRHGEQNLSPTYLQTVIDMYSNSSTSLKLLNLNPGI